MLKFTQDTVCIVQLVINISVNRLLSNHLTW